MGFYAQVFPWVEFLFVPHFVVVGFLVAVVGKTVDVAVFAFAAIVAVLAS